MSPNTFPSKSSSALQPRLLAPPYQFFFSIPKSLYCSHLFRVKLLLIHPVALFLFPKTSLNLSPANLFPVSASITWFFWLRSHWISPIFQPSVRHTHTKLSFPCCWRCGWTSLKVITHSSSSTTVTLGVFYPWDPVLFNNFWESAVLLPCQPMLLMPAFTIALLLVTAKSSAFSATFFFSFLSEKAHCWLILSSKDK